MNHELLALIRETGYLSDADLTDQQRFELLTSSFWRKAAALGYNVAALKRKLWIAASRPEEELIRILPDAGIQKAIIRTGKKIPGNASMRRQLPLLWYTKRARRTHPGCHRQQPGES
jgi:hypothetical protein